MPNIRSRERTTTRASRHLSIRQYKGGIQCLVLSLLATSILPSTALALEFRCSTQEAVRELRVEIPGKNNLCEVSVTELASGKRDVKWLAHNDSLFCSAKIHELHDKYVDQWGYTCTRSADADGIEKLSASQRRILDQRLKAHRAAGKNAQPPYSVLSVRAVASSPRDGQAAMIAFQFFTVDGDFTEIVDDQVNGWLVTNTFDRLSDYVISDVPVKAALMYSITDLGAIEIHTQLAEDNDTFCYGKQTLVPDDEGDGVKTGSLHRFSCQTDSYKSSALNKAQPLVPDSAMNR